LVENSIAKIKYIRKAFTLSKCQFMGKLHNLQELLQGEAT